MRFRFTMNDGPLPLWLQCEARKVHDEWSVRDIELYRDSSYSLPSLIADDVPFHTLPLDSQIQLSNWIEHQAQRGLNNAEMANAKAYADMFDCFLLKLSGPV